MIAAPACHRRQRDRAVGQHDAAIEHVLRNAVDLGGERRQRGTVVEEQPLGGCR